MFNLKNRVVTYSAGFGVKSVVLVLLVVAPPFRISWNSHLLIPQKSQSKFLLLDYHCCFYRLFSQTSGVVLWWHLTTVKVLISVTCLCQV